MSAINPLPLPQAPEVEQRPQPVAPPGPPGQPRKPSAGFTAGLCLVASLVTALAMWALANRGVDTSSGSGASSQARLAVATGGELLKSLRVGGTIETLNYAAIRVPQLRGPRDSGRADLTIMSLAPAGSIVKAGTVVAEFELRWLVDHIEDRESIVNRAQSNLKKRIADVQILKETERQARVTARAEYEKARLDLRTAEVRSKIEAEVLKNVSEEALATWGQLEDEGRIKEAVHAADIRGEELIVREEELHVNRHVRDLKRLQVKAPLPGMIVHESLFNKSGQFSQAKEGDQIYPGALFMRIVDVSQMVVSASVNQVDAQSIRIGDEAVVELDAYPGEQFRGRVVSIGAMASSGSGGSKFSRGKPGAFIKHIPMSILIEDRDERILPDLSASVDVRASDRPKGVLVPREALRSADGEAASFVYVHSDGQFLHREVRVQDVSDTEALIESGLQPGEEILLGGLPVSTEGYY
ncbi:MAG: HlyD family efflux transporter periplasmic adaptor subunit [Acidobacteriia bacterium]|nr:HlyD family efflux transporter periplasmic adaptor subunit [Terriglobia bacterium]